MKGHEANLKDRAIFLLQYAVFEHEWCMGTECRECGHSAHIVDCCCTGCARFQEAGQILRELKND